MDEFRLDVGFSEGDVCSAPDSGGCGAGRSGLLRIVLEVESPKILPEEFISEKVDGNDDEGRKD